MTSNKTAGKFTANKLTSHKHRKTTFQYQFSDLNFTLPQYQFTSILLSHCSYEDPGRSVGHLAMMPGDSFCRLKGPGM